MFKDDDEEEENTFGVTRYPCMPSLVALQQMRNRLHLAFLGRKLMKWTALATGRELRRLAQELYVVYDGFAEDLRNAFILLARSRYFYPTLNVIVTEDLGKKAGVTMQQSSKTVSGVKIVQFGIFETEYPPYPHLGIGKGGQTILETKKAWLELLRRLIMMLQLRAAFLMVELANRNANKKWNVVSKTIIPRTNLSCHYITSELEEIEREDNFRLKRFKELKIKKQKAKEKKMVLSIKQNSEEKSEIEVMDQNISHPDKTISSKNKIKSSVEFKDQSELNRKDYNKISKCCQTGSCVQESKYTEPEINCPLCNTYIQIIVKEYLSSCIGTTSEINSSSDDDISPTSQNQEAKSRIVRITCSCSQPADLKLSSDKDTQVVTSDKYCSTADGKESKLKVTKPSSKSICKEVKRKPQEENIYNEKVVESKKEIKIRRIVDKEGIITAEKLTITKTYKKKDSVGKCFSESNMYKKPNYGESDRTITATKPKLTGKCNTSCLKPCGIASTEVFRALGSDAVSFDASFQSDPEIKNRRTISTSKSASVASLYYSCIDKTISACDICSESNEPKTKLDNEKPESRYCTIKIFTKADSHVPSDEVHSIELTPSTLDLHSKILPQGNKPCPQVVPSPSLPEIVKIAGIEMKSVSTGSFTGSIRQSRSEVSKHLCVSKVIEPTHSIMKKKNSVAECNCKSKKSIDNTETKCPCSKLQNEPQENSEEKTCACSKEQRKEDECKCNKKQETTKPKCCNKSETPDTDIKSIDSKDSNICCKGYKKNEKSPLENTDSAEIPKPNLYPKCCQKSVTSNTDSKSIDSKDSNICCKGYKKNEKSPLENTDSVEIPKPNLDPKCCQKSVTSNTDSKSIDSKDSNICCKGYKKNEKSPLENTDSAEIPKPNLYPKCCQKSVTSNTDSKSIDSKDSNTCCKGYKKNEKSPLENTDSVEIPKPNLDPKCCQKSETPDTDGKSIASNDTICSKYVCSNEASKPETKDSMLKYCCCSKDEKTIPPECPICEKKIASTSTRRSDRYDVRTLRLLMHLRRARYSSLSDSVLVNNKSSTDTRVRKCMSCCCYSPEQK